MLFFVNIVRVPFISSRHVISSCRILCSLLCTWNTLKFICRLREKSICRKAVVKLFGGLRHVVNRSVTRRWSVFMSACCICVMAFKRMRDMAVFAVCLHGDVITWKRNRYYRPFVRGIHRLQVDSHHKCANNEELWCFLCCSSSQAVVQTVECPVVWVVIYRPYDVTVMFLCNQRSRMQCTPKLRRGLVRLI